MGGKSAPPPFVVGVTGASGAPIALAVLRVLRDAKEPTVLVLSEGARAVLKEEANVESADLDRFGFERFPDNDLAAPIASGSNPTRGMVIVPCSMNTVGRIASGLGDTLITRAAHVHLKERRHLILVPRETPLSTIDLQNLLRVSQAGAIVLIAAPPYYTRPKSVEDQTGFLAGKVLDHLGVAHSLYRGWRSDR